MVIHAAERVARVKAVTNGIKVELPSMHQRDDADMAQVVMIATSIRGPNAAMQNVLLGLHRVWVESRITCQLRHDEAHQTVKQWRSRKKFSLLFPGGDQGSMQEVPAQG
jgi:hypothetical protein